MIPQRTDYAAREITPELPLGSLAPPIIEGFAPAYTTDYGASYLSDGLLLLRAIRDDSVDAVITSPPYALEFKKEDLILKTVLHSRPTKFTTHFKNRSASIYRTFSSSSEFRISPDQLSVPPFPQTSSSLRPWHGIQLACKVSTK